MADLHQKSELETFREFYMIPDVVEMFILLNKRSSFPRDVIYYCE